MIKYSFLDRLLHRAALQFKPIAEMSFHIDQSTIRVDPEKVKQSKHVFVSGLARAGTTILLRRIYDTGVFCSLTYRDMPFILAPNSWGRISRKSKTSNAQTERAHGDRILIGIDSPESLDEVFWRVFDGDEYITKSHLKPHEPDIEAVEKYVAYVAAVLNADSQNRPRYLSKNNNNILRLGAIRRAFPNAEILIPFRHPLAHASSLMRQHENFIRQQQDDQFIRSYMTWLVHHEFGSDHRPFHFESAGGKRLAKLEPDGLDYWLEVWCQAYTWLEASAPGDAFFVCYEDLCQDTQVWDRLSDVCQIKSGQTCQETFVNVGSQIDHTASSELVDSAFKLYERLVERARSALQASQPK